ncbi:hypothetical protein BU16DRAFT_614538 [Lophium mytilinum]|uniref:Translation machinery-associated protein 16 n=1 Tax=Lophium mytilinum TaxID=390894 RepID=A0A6A6R7W0_9PEZI|nr:hypothetical protein BU16DRAFT_614538 [Lophium mytilinum]
MPGKGLQKVQKQIAKKKGRNTVLHEHSRDTQRLQRASARDDKIIRLTSLRNKQNRPYVDRVNLIKTEVGEKTTLSHTEIHAIIEKFLRRDDDELATIQAERRPGRPASNREGQLKERQKLEMREYDSGFWMPDLEDAANVKLLKDWEGQWVGLNTMKFVRMEKSGTRHESSYPPKGQS